MKNGFVYIEFLAALVIVIMIMFASLQVLSAITRSHRKVSTYYAERNQLLNMVERGEGVAKLVTANLYLKSVSVNSFTVDYFSN